MRSKLFLPALLMAMFMTISGILFVPAAHANPLQFKPTVQTASASSTPAGAFQGNFMTPGTATSSLAFDSYAAGQPFVTDQAALLLQFVSSSTASQVNINLEYSQDGVDWYQDGGTFENAFATSTKPFNLAQVNQYILPSSTSTVPGLGLPSATGATTTRAILVKTPTRFVRAVFSIPGGFGNGAIWSQWVPSRQING